MNMTQSLNGDSSSEHDTRKAPSSPSKRDASKVSVYPQNIMSLAVPRFGSKAEVEGHLANSIFVRVSRRYLDEVVGRKQLSVN